MADTRAKACVIHEHQLEGMTVVEKVEYILDMAGEGFVHQSNSDNDSYTILCNKPVSLSPREAERIAEMSRIMTDDCNYILELDNGQQIQVI